MSGPVKFVGGSYLLNTRKADVQRTINMFPEVIESGSGKSGVILQSIPGLTSFSEPYVPPLPPGDPYWDNVILMLHFLPGAPFYDDSQYHQTVEVINTPPLTDGPFDGSGAMVQRAQTSPELKQPQLITSSDIGGLWSHSAAEPWTFDQWVYIHSTANISLTQVWEWATLIHDDFFNQFGFYADTHEQICNIDGTNFIGGYAAFSADTWHFTRTIFTGATNLCQVWIDGVMVKSFARPLGNSPAGAYFVTGARNATENRDTLDMKTTEMRVTKGVARDGTEVPTRVFPNYGVGT